MTVFYKKYQLSRKGSEDNGKWYARAVQTETVDINTLAEEMEQNCTVKRADILAVLSELVVSMKQHLQASHRVKIDKLGSFKMAISTKLADTAKDFTTTGNVKNIRIIFSPESKVNKDKTRSRALIDGCKVAELPKNAVVDDDSTADKAAETTNLVPAA